MESKLFIIPQKNRSIIAKLENNLITEIGKIDVPYSSKSVFLKNRLIISLCFGSKQKNSRLKIFNESGKQLQNKKEYKFETINSKDNTVYLGGQYKSKDGELFSFINLSENEFNMKNIKLPVQTIKGKSIDDILIRNDDLFLVDNIIYPKYVFKYNISEADNPTHIDTYKLKNNGTYEHIIKGDINEEWIILLSSTVGMKGSYRHISIIGKNENWINDNTLTFSADKILDIYLLKNKLFILKENGLFSVCVSDNTNQNDILQINNNENKYDKFIKIDNENCIILNDEKYELVSP